MTEVFRMAMTKESASPTSIDRRSFIKTVALSSGGLMLAIRTSLTRGADKGNTDSIRSPEGFIHIAPDDTIKLIMPAVEMGQGTHTALAIIMMEELEGDWDKLVTVDAPVADIYRNPAFHEQITVGSVSVRGWYQDLLKTAAAAREMLIRAAASQWEVPVTECLVRKGVIVHQPSGRQFRYGEVASLAAGLDCPADPAVKSARLHRYVGSPRNRLDTAKKIDGSAQFGSDKMLPGMLYAAVKTCPTHGGKLKSFDVAAAQREPGFHRAIPLDDGIAAIASSYWQAKKALDKITVTYDPGELSQLDNESISTALHQAMDRPLEEFHRKGDTKRVLDEAADVIEATYDLPYLAHACMEPMNCTAHVTPGGCEVWTGTQAPEKARRTVAAVLGLAEEKVKIHSMYLGGGFGRRGETDYVAQAVRLARVLERPVKVLWSREEDIKKGYYRPRVLSKYRAGFDPRGNLLALESKIVTSAAPPPRKPGAPIYTWGLLDASYHIPNVYLSGTNLDLGIRYGFWRSVSHSHTAFARETFIDECAHQAGKDPYLFRRELLENADARRPLKVLETIAEQTGWGEASDTKRFRGISLTEAFGSWLAMVAEVSVEGRAIKLHRVSCALDCGIAVNPAQIEAQLEGGVVYGLTAALFGGIDIDKGAVKQSNFHDYRMLGMSQMPEVDVYIIPSEEDPGGAGEIATALIAPALGNALFQATGERIRVLPLSKSGFSLA